MPSSSVRKTLFCCPALTFIFWLKRASFATKESLFFSKVGKVTFSARKSLPCRYSALSLHLETDERWPIPFSSSFAQRSLCLRFWRRRKAQGNAAAETRHKREFVPKQQTFSRHGIVQTLHDLPSALGLSRTFFDIFAYWFFSRLGGWNLYMSSGLLC